MHFAAGSRRRESRVAVKDCVASGVRFALQQPGEHPVRAILNSRALTQAVFLARAVGQRGFPVPVYLPVADESALVLAEIEATFRRHQFLPAVVDENVLPGNSQILAVGGNPLVTPALDGWLAKAPPKAERPISTAAFVVQGQLRRLPGDARRHGQPDAILRRAGVQCVLEGLAQAFDRAGAFGQGYRVGGDATLVSREGGIAARERKERTEEQACGVKRDP